MNTNHDNPFAWIRCFKMLPTKNVPRTITVYRQTHTVEASPDVSLAELVNAIQSTALLEAEARTVEDYNVRIFQIEDAYPDCHIEHDAKRITYIYDGNPLDLVAMAQAAGKRLATKGKP